MMAAQFCTDVSAPCACTCQDRRSAVRLRRAPTGAQRRVLALICEGPSYAKMATRLGCSRRTVRNHVIALADLLPAGFIPDGGPKERVILYAVRLYAETTGQETR